MLGKMDEMAEAGGMSMSEPFIVGETIKIIEGPFNDFNGIIEEVNDEKEETESNGKDIRSLNPGRAELHAGGKNIVRKDER